MHSPKYDLYVSTPSIQNSNKFKKSLIFRTVGRNTKPSWSNRIVKDVNNLHYNLHIDLFGQEKSHSVTLDNHKNTRTYYSNKSKTILRDKRKSFFSQEL